MIHAETSFLALPLLRVNPESGAQRGSSVSGCRLHPDLAEWPLVAHARVKYAVERDTTGHAERLRARLLVEPRG